MKKASIILILTVLFLQKDFSQTSPITFGAISKEDLEMQPYAKEKGAEAVVLCDYASASLIFNEGFKVEIERHVRIKIFKPAGYAQGNIRIDYTRDDKLSDLKASTYNLVNNAVEETPVGKKQFYQEKTYPFEYATRFAFPQVREGSIIEYTYKMTQAEIREFVPFDFQTSIPMRHVEYWAVIPDIFTYTIKFNGSNKINKVYTQKQGYFETLSTLLKIYVWTGNNMPALQPEYAMPESHDYFPGVRFALTTVNFPQRLFEVSPSYKKLTTDLLQFSDFGAQLNNQMLFSKEVREIIKGKATKIEQMQALYDHVKDRVKWNGMKRLASYEPIRKAYRDKTGNSADINSILINMLRTAGINSDAVVLSTREKGTLNPVVALMGDLNYVICLAEIDGKEYLLDATDKFRPMGMLPYRCLNNEGWVLNESRGRWIKLLGNEKNSMKEFYDIKIEDNGKISASVTFKYEGYDAVNMRQLIYDQGDAGLKEELVDSIGNFGYSEIEIKNFENINEPLIVTFSIGSSYVLPSGNHLTFFKPLFGSPGNEWIKDERVYPVDLGCPEYNNIICVYHLPDFCRIEDLPKSIRLLLPNSDASYSYKISNNENLLTISEEFNMSKTWFDPDEYPQLREFYTQINKKKNEMVVLQNKNN